MNNNSTSWIQKRALTLVVLASVLPGWSASFAESVSQPVEAAPTSVVIQAGVAQAPTGRDWEHFRVSAIAGVGDNLSVGIVNTRDGSQNMVAVGKSLSAGVICLSADCDKQTAILDWAGTMVELSLTGSTNLTAPPPGQPAGAQVNGLSSTGRKGKTPELDRAKARHKGPMTEEERLERRAAAGGIGNAARFKKTLPQGVQPSPSEAGATQSTPPSESEAPSPFGGL